MVSRSAGLLSDRKVAGSNPCTEERRENFLLQGPFSVLTLISVSVPPPCYRRQHVKDPGHSQCQKCMWQVTAKHAYTVLPQAARKGPRLILSAKSACQWQVTAKHAYTVLPQQHVKDPGSFSVPKVHVSGRLQLNTHTPCYRCSTSRTPAHSQCKKCMSVAGYS